MIFPLIIMTFQHIILTFHLMIMTFSLISLFSLLKLTFIPQFKLNQSHCFHLVNPCPGFDWLALFTFSLGDIKHNSFYCHVNRLSLLRQGGGTRTTEKGNKSLSPRGLRGCTQSTNTGTETHPGLWGRE